jgi:aerobic carbon-monoxide dehydrogenase medium subunit
MKAAAFDYRKVQTIDQAIGLLQDFGDNAKLIAGGQSLLPSLNMRLSAPELLIDLNGVDELKGIQVRTENNQEIIFLGAMTTHTEIEDSAVVAEKLPLLKKAVPHIAHRAIRNLGTWGGSIVYGDPAAEWPACAIALGGVMVIAGPEGRRKIAAKDFFIDLYTTDLQANEILLGTEFTLSKLQTKDYFDELARRHGDYAIAGLTVQIEHLDDVIKAARIVYFSIASTPIVAAQAQTLLVGTSLQNINHPDLVLQCQIAVRSEIQTMSDLTNSAKMKTHLIGVLIERALVSLAK